MGGNVADYSIIADRAFSLAVQGDLDRTIKFGIPGKTLKEQASIISFLLREAENLRLQIHINGTLVFDDQFGSGVMRCIQEVVKEKVLEKNDNEITFTVKEGEGRFSDIVLWFQRRT